MHTASNNNQLRCHHNRRLSDVHKHLIQKLIVNIMMFGTTKSKRIETKSVGIPRQSCWQFEFRSTHYTNNKTATNMSGTKRRKNL